MYSSFISLSLYPLFCLALFFLHSSRTAWNNSLWHDMVDDEDPDSDTDSRLSGSVAVDSVM